MLHYFNIVKVKRTNYYSIQLQLNTCIQHIVEYFFCPHLTLKNEVQFNFSAGHTLTKF